ncbi:hypothetical protein EST38_g8475 [Candolleomyces aberdarensis]|uniref:Nephrocystin 3-like N-terminal domain-containing protein n=1 Tax=Candolleomyces aberdarensis TaxID=2316362 RepID=A0A4Q2DCJ9_9AGAR|nr:hypothetical protein EST38_g8475 [Candolleomyces aberdarensis]
MTVNTGGEKSIDGMPTQFNFIKKMAIDVLLNCAGWSLLLKNIAPNALHDSSARYDAPKCDEDTRVEVTGEIMDWIQDRSPTQRLLCMTGAAGAGKSALQQTIAERCTGSDILAAAFFFSSTDPTRNTASAIVPTIAYQIGLKHLLFQSSIVAAVKHDPLIFSRSLKSQMEALIVRPFESLRRSNKFDIGTFPYVILIDGLDECSGSPSSTSNSIHIDIDVRRQAEDRQAELLDAIKHCILDNDLPFRLFIASRPEWAIRTALEPGGYLRQATYLIRLSDEYDASGDMRRYLQRRFEVIGLRIGNSLWFTEHDIEVLVNAASGQFVYVATVFKYISERRASPAKRLKAVLDWTPHIGQTTRPFESLDRLYANIVLNAKSAYEAVDTHHGRDFLLLLSAHHMNAEGFPQPDTPLNQKVTVRISADVLSALLRIEAEAEEDTLFSDLRSLMAFEKGDHGVLRLLPDACEEILLSYPHRVAFSEAVDDLTWFLRLATAIDDEVADFTHKDGWTKIDKVLSLASHHSQLPEKWFPDWIKFLRRFAENLTQQPEAVAIINKFVEKWECDASGWRKPPH